MFYIVSPIFLSCSQSYYITIYLYSFQSTPVAEEKTAASTPKSGRRKISAKSAAKTNSKELATSITTSAINNNNNNNNESGTDKENVDEVSDKTAPQGKTPASKCRVKKPKVTAKRTSPTKPVSKLASSTTAAAAASSTPAGASKRTMPKRRKSKKTAVLDMSDADDPTEDDQDYCPDGQALQQQVEDEEGEVEADEEEDEGHKDKGEVDEDDEILADIKVEPDSEPDGENSESPGKMTPVCV